MSLGVKSINPKHVARLDRAGYLGMFFKSENIDNFARDILKNKDENLAKNIINNSARLSWIADKIDTFAKGRPTFQIMYYIIIAESVAKLADNYKGEGKSKHYSIKFFKEFLPDHYYSVFSKSFENLRKQKFLNVEETATLLYKIRCDLSHEGKYFYFNLRFENDKLAPNSHFDDLSIVSHITLNELKAVVLSGAINAAKSAIVTVELIRKYESEEFWA